MINPDNFIDWLNEARITRFVGVPDSVLKSLSSAIERHSGCEDHVISANEGAAVGYAVGSYIESSRPACVYLQNSGLGNALNPLLALAHRGVYGSPMLLIVGWRGEPGHPDERQHLEQGRITQELLDSANVPYVILSDNEKLAKVQIRRLLEEMTSSPGPVAILIRQGTFESGDSVFFGVESLEL